AIDAGNNSAGLGGDQRGFVRTFDDPAHVNGPAGATDIGALEQGAPAAAPTTVTSVKVNKGATQRSMVTNIVVTFSEAVTLPANPADAFQLARTGPGAPTGLVNLSAVQAGNTVTITFVAGGPVGIDPAGSLKDGAYQLTILAANVTGV